ncbi:MAG TPA: 30S ribosomal protein S4 [Candidatus Stercoripulliclostridium merdipullorum]|uniref:Small ribosomal subunit protein uS4 n=1 Tax=Candidatus Stercoripulliclostridium merdipullorum TaxID=2840952 RepID=A0A9D1NB55_9FIRM|nr:30S ribosomal protein S4 [Candidatus Stercoripulliclostridium merdipullorum]
MAKYTGPVCKLCRREGCKLFLKGDRCFSRACAMEKRPVAPGQHGAARKKSTPYSVQLREKQKAKRAYGLLEKQFHMYYEMAEKMRGVTGENMLSLIERRLDNVVYRMGIGSSRAQARQLVNHGHITVNGKKVDIASYLTKAGDVIAVKENKRANAYFTELKESKIANMPKWLTFDPATLTGSIVELPKREDVDLSIAEHMIIELYSK